ncbi:MAG: metallophosphoesterase [Calditrichaeota bacterium]|nr:metallophosphoesterase [Calditrichota bacterium]
MKYLIFSDVHGNLFGLERVLQFARQNAIDRLYCLGDLVGYNGFPRECIERIRRYSIPCVKGNHEGLLLGELSGFSRIAERAQHSLRVTRNLLSAEEKAFLQNLPFSLSLDDQVVCVHANLWDVKQTVNTVEKARRNFEGMRERRLQIVFFGHTHRPEAFVADRECQTIERLQEVSRITIETDRYYLINPGTVGVPRHGLPFSFVVYDTVNQQVTYHPFRLTDEEEQLLARRNREVFGGFSIRRLPAQLRERIRKFYYTLSK